MWLYEALERPADEGRGTDGGIMNKAYAPMVAIDRDSSIPLYEQIAGPIEAAIVSGDLPSGAMLEDEVSMAARLDVARPTARRALQELVNKGLLSRRRGVGTRVTPTHVHRPMKLSSLNDDLSDAGFTPSTKVLSYLVREASAQEAGLLGIQVGDGVLSVKRLRFADDHPLAILTNVIPMDIAPTWQDLGTHGLYRCLGERGIDIASAQQEIGARGADPEEAATLGESVGAPLLTMHRVGRNTEGRSVEIGNHVYRPGLYSFKFSLFSS